MIRLKQNIFTLILSLALSVLLIACSAAYDTSSSSVEKYNISAFTSWAAEYQDETLMRLFNAATSRRKDDGQRTEDLASSCFSQFQISADNRLPFKVLQRGLNEAPDLPKTTFYTHFYSKIPEKTKDIEILISRFEREVDSLLFQSKFIEIFSNIRLLEEMSLIFQQSNARFDRLVGVVSEGAFDNDEQASELVSAIPNVLVASDKLTDELLRVKQGCLSLMSRLTGLPQGFLAQNFEDTWTRQLKPLPGLHPWFPIQLLSQRPDISVGLQIFNTVYQAEINENFFLIGKTEVTGESIHADFGKLGAADQSALSIRERQLVYDIGEAWLSVIRNANMDVSSAIFQYNETSDLIKMLEMEIQFLQREVEDEFMKFDLSTANPRLLFEKINRIRSTAVKLSFARRDYAVIWSVINLSIGQSGV